MIDASRQSMTRVFRLGSGLAALLLAGGCMLASGGRTLHLEPTASLPEDIRYRLITYGGIGPNNFETLAVLDREDDRYRIASYTGEIAVKVREGLTAAAALQEAESFLSWQNTYRDMEIRAITGPEGHVFGYELRPLYWLAGARGDAVDTSYVLGSDDTVTFYVYLRQRFRRLDNDGLDGGFLLRE